MSDADVTKKPAKAKRVACGLCVAAVWLAAIFLLPPWALAALLTVAAGICLYELCAMLKKVGYALPFRTLAALTVVWFGMVYVICEGMFANLDIGPLLLALFVLMPLWPMAVFFRVLLGKRIERPMEVAALSVTAFLYIPVMLSALLPIALFRDNPGDSCAPGIFLAFALVLVTKLADTGGYFVGTAIGRHKMCPRLSPGKSWEGTIGGYLFALVGAGCVVAAARVWPEATCLDFVRELTCSVPRILWAALTVVAIVTVGILGDLLESLFKRQCGVKDSSALFPAMGGFFDTFDSIVFVPVTFLAMFGLGCAAMKVWA